ncbi:MAG: helix-turn-helix transcriptional regulator [Lachnospiraceae bacterium]|nr:helix-turn-helix transcriptional regulator [Lachnospiraceae bacterium]MBD5454934.1 helix-turn-helix transcriptional regulator [Lachnospiraceae bacterium]
MVAVDYKDLGSRIRIKRKEHKMSQEELAGKAQLSTQHISNVENARSKIGLEKLVDIANVLDCSLDELACGSVNSGRTVYNREIAEMIEDFSDTQRRALPKFLRDFNYLYKLMEIEYEKQNE